MAKDRGVEARVALDTSGLSITIQKRIKSFGEPVKTSSFGSSIKNCDISVSTEQIVSANTVQHGHIASSETSVKAINVGNVSRPIRCISPHSDVTVVRSELGTLAVHGSSQTGEEVGF